MSKLFSNKNIKRILIFLFFFSLHFFLFNHELSKGNFVSVTFTKSHSVSNPRIGISRHIQDFSVEIFVENEENDDNDENEENDQEDDELNDENFRLKKESFVFTGNIVKKIKFNISYFIKIHFCSLDVFHFVPSVARFILYRSLKIFSV